MCHEDVGETLAFVADVEDDIRRLRGIWMLLEVWLSRFGRQGRWIIGRG